MAESSSEERRGSKRRSVLLATADLVGAARQTVVAKFRKDIDPEEEPDFAERNPTWEDALPPIHGVTEDLEIPSLRAGPSQISSFPAALLPFAEILTGISINPSDSHAKQRWKNAYSSVKKELIMKKQNMRSAVGTGARMDGYSLGLWDSYSPSRLALFHALYNQKTEYFLAIVICCHLIILTMKASDNLAWAHVKMYSLDVADNFITFLYTIECFLRILCLGAFKGPHSYFRNGYNRLDFVIILDSWIHITVKSAFGKDRYARIAVLRAFRVLLVLRDYSFFSNVIAIMDAIKRSIGPLENVIFLTFLVLSYYSLLAIQFLGSSLLKRCTRTTDNQVSYPARFCDVKANTASFICPKSQNQSCKVYGNANYGATNFDNFPHALLTMFQVISLEGWSLLMYEIKDSNSANADAYFVSLVILGTYFLISVFVAAISGVFLRVRQEHQILLKRARQKNQLTFFKATVMATALKDVIIEDDSKLRWYERLLNRSTAISIKLKSAFKSASFKMTRLTTFDEVMIGSKRMDMQGLSRNHSNSLSRSLSMGTQAALTIQQKAQYIVENYLFRYSELVAVSTNMVVLCLIHEGMSKQLLYTTYAMEAIFLVVFTLEMALRFVAYGFVRYCDDKMNLWDTMIIVVSAGAVMTRVYPNISAARILRWFYSTKEEADKNTTIMVICMKSLGALASVAFFYLLVIFVFSIMGMELYGGQFYNFSDGYPRANHDNIFQAMLLWFSVTTGESWVNQMWNGMRHGVKQNWTAPFLFVFYYAITAYVVLNLVIAVILEKNELTDNQKKHIQKASLVEFLKLLKARQSKTFARSSTWVGGAVKGAEAGMKSFVKRLKTMKVKPISIPAQEISVAGNEDSVPFLKSKQELESTEPPSLGLPGGSTQPVKEQFASSTDGARRTSRLQVDNVSKVSEVNLDKVQEQGSVKRRTSLSRRASQILQNTGFTPEIINNGRRRTTLESAVLSLMAGDSKLVNPGLENVNSDLESLHKLAPPMDRTQSSFKRSTSKPTRISFQLSDYELFQPVAQNINLQKAWYMSGYALFIFAESSPVRKFCGIIVENIWYMRFILLWVAISIFVLAEMTSKGKSVLWPNTLPHVDKVIIAVFASDLALKLVAHGFLLTPEPYIGDLYNLTDLSILLIEIVSLMPLSQPEKRIVRALLALRPLRLVCRVEGLRNLFSTLLRTLPAIASVLIFTFTIFSIFAVIGVQLFRGLLFSCNDGGVNNRAYCTGNFVNSAEILSPRVWDNPPFHFDDVGTAMLSLFVVSTFDNWVGNVLYPVMDISHRDEQPIRNFSPLNALYFVAFVSIGGFFILRMFVGVFIDQFGLKSGSKLLTERQKLMRDMNRIIQKLTPVKIPEPPSWYISNLCHRIQYSPWYPKIMIGVIIINYIFLSTHYAGETVTVALMRKRIQCGFVSTYLLEMLMKFFGNEKRHYLTNFADAFEVFLSITGAACLFPPKDSMRQLMGRLVYATRIFCIVRHIPRATTLVRTLYICLPSMLDIMGLLMIFLFCFAGVGVQVFADVKDGQCLGPWMTFRSFTSAFITVFQVTTADNWSCIMVDTMVNKPYCTDSKNLQANDCGSTIGGVVYFVTLITLASHIFMNLFVAIILDAITFGILSENAMITPDHLTKFQLLWADKAFDPKCTGYIGIHKLRSFVDKLGIPLGRRHNASTQWYTRIEYEVLSFYVPKKGIPFKQLLETLTLYKVGPTGLPLPLRVEREKQILNTYREGATIKIQAAVRGFLVRRRMAKSKPKQEKIKYGPILFE
ncbi:hypothetical protein O6H91_02G023500 [Diphasiastrum complanatum]|uniref:Uncharacterized protein n=1 Tax=Diphasiastrum complanatum TaxID=34168 RepID=A0ACC2EDM4_DIPCM|nr:hypothetical protein O6H91_02G023500 [Diphasiastrum complanatum]